MEEDGDGVRKEGRTEGRRRREGWRGRGIERKEEKDMREKGGLRRNNRIKGIKTKCVPGCVVRCGWAGLSWLP